MAEPDDEARYLEAAQRVLRRDGVAAVTHERVAEEAGVEVTELQTCFAERGDLLDELNLFCSEQRVEGVDAAVAPTTSGEQALDAFFRHVVGISKEQLQEFRLSVHATQVLPELMAPRSRESGERHRRIGNSMFDGVEAKLLSDWGDEMLPHGVHPRRMAFVAGLLAQGFLNMKGILDVSGQNFVHAEDDLVDMMSNVMCAPPRMIRQLTALNGASRELAAMRTEKELLDRVPVMLTEAFDFDRCTLLMDHPGRGLGIESTSWTEQDERELVRQLIAERRLLPPPHLRRCVAEDRTIFVPDPETDPDWPPVPDEQALEIAKKVGFRSSSLFTPLRCEGKPVGLLLANTHLRWRPMDAQDISRVEAFAAMVGVALQNVRLLENLNAQVDERTRALRDAQAQLVQSEKMASLGKLVAGVAHDLNTPLGAVSSSRDSMAKGTERIRSILEEEFPEAAGHAKLGRALEVVERAGEAIGTGTERIEGAVTRLRSFARLDQAELQLVTVEDCLRDALAVVEPRLGAIALERDFGDTPAIRCDPAGLNQVFLNVLANAVEWMDAGTLRASTRAADEDVVVTIEDEGCGIAPEHVERVFDPGFTTRNVRIGSGLGLSIAYQIVNDHGGRIALQSELGRGTTVTISLPSRRVEPT